MPNRPFFDTIELKGGGDAASAARAVIQTGEYDYAWNMQVEDDILKRLEQGGKGRINISLAGDIEHIQLNNTDPWTEVDGERSSAKSKHPFLTDPAVRQALALLVDRGSVQEQLYGRQGQATANFLNAPSKFSSKNNKWELNPDKAAQILEAAGWKKGSDGIRAKDGKKLKMVYQTSINAVRQKTQAIVKQAAAKAGIEIELKSVVASVFFASDPANWDTYPHFATDLQMYTTTMTHPDPQRLMDQFTSWEVASKENKWLGRNPTRWQQRGVRPALEVGRGGDGSRQARRHVHPDERPAHPERGRDPGDLAREGLRALQQAEGHRHQRVGFGPGEPGVLASGGVEPARGLGPALAGAKPPGHRSCRRDARPGRRWAQALHLST